LQEERWPFRYFLFFFPLPLAFSKFLLLFFKHKRYFKRNLLNVQKIYLVRNTYCKERKYCSDGFVLFCFVLYVGKFVSSSDLKQDFNADAKMSSAPSTGMQPIMRVRLTTSH